MAVGHEKAKDLKFLEAQPVRVVAPDEAPRVQPEHHIRDNGVVLLGEGVAQAVRPVVDHISLVALLGHDLAQSLRQVLFIFDDQGPHDRLCLSRVFSHCIPES